MYHLPQQFIENMKKQLPKDEWEPFFSAYENSPYKGVRLYVLKGDRYALKAVLPFLDEQIAWEENGFYTKKEKAGASPYHFAGLFYMQEPSAMSAAPLLNVQKGERVLDLCSAPGGKGTQLAAAMQGEGVLVLNEPMKNRAKILSQNVERLGVKNAVVCSEMPQRLAEKFPAYFDKILVDAPCSGEGMFRKNAEEALAEWSEENVALCAERQKEILHAAESMLKVGGKLVYSTCTFAPQEDEEQVLDFVQSHPNMRLIKQDKLYPHKVKGEGHFVALFEKTDGAGAPSPRIYKGKCGLQAEKIYRQFEKELFVRPQAEYLHEQNGALYALPVGVFDWQGLHVLRVGVKLGELKNGRFEPDHALAMSVPAKDCKRVADLTAPQDVEKYLRGETVEQPGENGWTLVCVNGYPVGWGKRVGDTLKNHLPKGLRMSVVEQ